MNRERRKRLRDVADRLEAIRADLQQIAEEETGAFDNMPEGLQESERGQRMQEAADELENAASSVEDIQSALEPYA